MSYNHFLFDFHRKVWLLIVPLLRTSTTATTLRMTSKFREGMNDWVMGFSYCLQFYLIQSI